METFTPGRRTMTTGTHTKMESPSSNNKKDSTQLLVPMSVPRASTGSNIFSHNNHNNNNKEKHQLNDSNTPSHNKAAGQYINYDTFMSPIKSAMKSYPVLSPRRKQQQPSRQSLITSPLGAQQASINNTSISVLDNDQSMTSATASILDDMIMHSENEPEEHDRGQQQHEGERQEHQEIGTRDLYDNSQDSINSSAESEEQSFAFAALYDEEEPSLLLRGPFSPAKLSSPSKITQQAYTQEENVTLEVDSGTLSLEGNDDVLQVQPESSVSASSSRSSRSLELVRTHESLEIQPRETVDQQTDHDDRDDDDAAEDTDDESMEFDASLLITQSRAIEVEQNSMMEKDSENDSNIGEGDSSEMIQAELVNTTFEIATSIPLPPPTPSPTKKLSTETSITPTTKSPINFFEIQQPSAKLSDDMTPSDGNRENIFTQAQSTPSLVKVSRPQSVTRIAANVPLPESAVRATSSKEEAALPPQPPSPSLSKSPQKRIANGSMPTSHTPTRMNASLRRRTLLLSAAKNAKQQPIDQEENPIPSDLSAEGNVAQDLSEKQIFEPAAIVQRERIVETPLATRTARAAAIALPDSVSRRELTPASASLSSTSRITRRQSSRSPVKLHQDLASHDGNVLGQLPYASENEVCSPVKHKVDGSTAIMRELAFAKTAQIPSPMKQVRQNARVPESTMLDDAAKNDLAMALLQETEIAEMQIQEQQEVREEMAQGYTISDAESGSSSDTHLISDETFTSSRNPEEEPASSELLSIKKDDVSTPRRNQSPITESKGSGRLKTTPNKEVTDAPKESTPSKTRTPTSLHIPSNMSIDEPNDSSLESMSAHSQAAPSKSRNTLKRKASKTLLPSADQSNSEASDVVIPERRITRQRSLTLLQNVQVQIDAETEAAPNLVEKAGSRVEEGTEERSADVTISKVQNNEDASVQDDSKTKLGKNSKVTSSTRTRRQSTRIASVSGLPQPSSRLPRRGVASNTAKQQSADSATAPAASTLPKPTQKNSVESALTAEDTDMDEDDGPTVCSTRLSVPVPVPIVGPAPALTTAFERERTPEDVPPIPLIPPGRRAQRAARPARSTTAATARTNAKPLPSPSRVASPLKRPMRAGRGQNSKPVPVPNNNMSSLEVGSSSSQLGAGTGRTVLRSPGRVLSPAKGVTTLRSPGRAQPYNLSARSPRPPASPSFDWSSVPQVDKQSAMLRQLSPDASRKAFRIFGSSSASEEGSASTGVASSAGNASGAPLSPIKGLAHRLSVTASPSLLGLAVAPELLVLAPPSPSPKKDQFTPSEASSSQKSMLAVSTASAPEARRSSVPLLSMSQSGQAMSMSPRRAVSAQPVGSLSRPNLPSPRRVPLSSAKEALGAQNIFQTAVHARQGTTLPTPITQTGKGSMSTSASAAKPAVEVAKEGPVSRGNLDAPEPRRRSSRSARPSRVSQASSAPTSARATNDLDASEITSQVQCKTPKPFTPAQLQSLTSQNTSNNCKPYNLHNVTVVHKDEDRPPSPTKKIRKLGEEASATASKTAKLAKSALVNAAKESRQASGLLQTGTKRPHFQAAGDEDIYESPVKARGMVSIATTSECERPNKTVKWDRDLLKASAKISTPTDPKPAASGGKGVVRRNKVLQLDAFGNIPDGGISMSPLIPRTKVEISKIIYRDDSPEEDS